MDDQQLRQALALMADAASEAGLLTLRYFQQAVAVERKADDSPVTRADREAEQILRRRFERETPDHAILGEEFGATPGRGPGRWIIDPIDGTFSFICGVPLYSTLIGLEWDGRMVAGVIHLPAIGTTVLAARGLGCTFNGRPARVSAVADLAAARLSTTTWKNATRHGRLGAMTRLLERCAADRGWPDAYAYALLAAGAVDIVLDPAMSVWDTAALVPIVEEAGGRLTDWTGRPGHTVDHVVATNGLLHDAVLATLGGLI